MKIWRIAFMMLAAFSLASCSSEEDNEDKVEQVTIYVSEETGVYYDMWLDPEKENPIEGMQIWENKTQTWQIVSFYAIKGFTYERGNEYELLVRKTTLATPPYVRYELIRIVSQKKVE
ncbi:MAG: DUF4377 domain-containing protein [Prevotella sp.]|nr:DUF4377 domain-containing protein [Prevotella sp.]